MIKRSLKNYLLFPGAQLKHGLLFVGVSTLLHGVLTALSILFVDAWLAGKSGVGHLPFWQVLIGIIAIYLLFLLFIFSFGLLISHKWLGPLVPIEKFVAGLVRGESVQRLALRKGDMAHVRKLADLLNELADLLEKNEKHEKNDRRI